MFSDNDVHDTQASTAGETQNTLASTAGEAKNTQASAAGEAQTPGMTGAGEGQAPRSPWLHFVDRCGACTACDLHRNRTNAVVWRGSVRAPLLIIGEGPGQREDEEGMPFVGPSGQLLDTLLTALEIGPDSFHIANIVKCRPPENREPTLEEAKACRPLLNEQFKFVRPKVILLVGKSAYQYFTGDLENGITKVRGVWIEKGGYWIMPTYHPAYVLRDNQHRTALWEDMLAVRQKLEELGQLKPIQG